MQQTSLDAYFTTTKPNLGKNQKTVLHALKAIAPATNKQIAARLNWPINSVTPRVLELRQKKVIVKAYVGKDGDRAAIYWMLKKDTEAF